MIHAYKKKKSQEIYSLANFKFLWLAKGEGKVIMNSIIANDRRIKNRILRCSN
jgi:hypothetical protein